MSTTTAPVGSVVVGTDGSAHAEVALDWAAAEATRRGTGLHVLYAYPWLARARAWEFAPDLAELTHGDDVAAAAAARARSARPGLAVTTEVVVDDPSVAITLASCDAAVVVVGARGLGAVAEVLGSVSLRVAEHAYAPVVVVRADGFADDTRRVAVGLDPHDDDGKTLRYALDDARRRHVGLLAVQGVQLSAEHPDDVYVRRLTEAVEAGEGRVRDRLDAWRERYPDVPVELRQVREHPVDALAEAAAECAVVVVGSRGHGGLAGLLLGSVSRALLHRAPVVAVVRHVRE
ncbi:universal stress protein [Georgenia muralis]|uniref:Nucleotide-binding universal stress UspA family protein n=1 Tax=Georgenia muralis TaxID=154117 RepID=A0A3N4Z6I1_9MICO|nr:universal stress protein [Georgenia muralis]RPF27937.1 nucleotide-binding universal stress UspA family protein [Georgenia muralis]